MVSLLFVGAAVGVGWWLLSPPTPLKHRDLTPERLFRLVDALYHRGFDGGELRIVKKGIDGPVVRLIKRIVVDDDVRLALEVPGTRTLTADQRVGLERALGGFQIPSGDGGAVDVGADLHRASGVARAILEEVYGLSMQQDCIATLHNVTEANIRVGWTH